MNVLIVGTGVIGTIYGWTLKESGIHVAHLVSTIKPIQPDSRTEKCKQWVE